MEHVLMFLMALVLPQSELPSSLPWRNMWLCNCNSLKVNLQRFISALPEGLHNQIKQKNQCMLHVAQLLDSVKFTCPVKAVPSWPLLNLCITHLWCCFPSESPDERAAERGQRKRRRVLGTSHAGEWPTLILPLSLCFDCPVSLRAFIISERRLCVC